MLVIVEPRNQVPVSVYFLNVFIFHLDFIYYVMVEKFRLIDPSIDSVSSLNATTHKTLS